MITNVFGKIILLTMLIQIVRTFTVSRICLKFSNQILLAGRNNYGETKYQKDSPKFNFENKPSEILDFSLTDEERLQKIIARAGLASRRGAESLVYAYYCMINRSIQHLLFVKFKIDFRRKSNSEWKYCNRTWS